MKWTELRKLLSPTPAKIILFLVLFVLFVPIVSYDTGVRCITTPCPSSAPGSAVAYLLSSQKTIYQVYYAAAFTGAVASYIIACLLVSLARNWKR